MHRHGDLGQQRIARVIDGEFADAFKDRQIARRLPSLGLKPGREIGSGRNHGNTVSGATGEMRGPLVDEDPQIGVKRIGKQTRKGQDSQWGSLSQLRQFRSLQQTDSSTISRNSDQGFTDLSGWLLERSKTLSISAFEVVRRRNATGFGSKLAAQ